MDDRLAFCPIDLERHADLFVTFRRDSYASSVERGADWFGQQNGTDGSGYISRLQELLREFPAGCVHAWDSDRIVAQLEFTKRADGTGYVNLFYLVPDVRGSAGGAELHAYVLAQFQALQVTRAKLCISSTNPRAVAFYRKFGWRDIGPREDHPGFRFYELDIET
jgi:ribosomal protein S18 acetylase RimI-like enzyme